MIRLKRIYEAPARSDGTRVLVDRLWPRGISKERAKLDCWLKELAPSTELRKWFSHDPKKWQSFKRKYTTELKENKEAIHALRKLQKRKKILALLYGAKDEEHNEAIVLKEFLER